MFIHMNVGKYGLVALIIPHLHIGASGEANSETNKCTNHIFTSSFVASFASPFVTLALEAVFEHEWKGTNDENRSFALKCTNMRMFIHMWKQFIRIEIETYECSCKWRGEAPARMCKYDIRIASSPFSVFQEND